jgi:hypothetical protein
MDAKLLSDKQIGMISERDRKLLGIATMEEKMNKMEAKNERELQKQIVQYLRLRGIEVIWHATHKKSTATTGTPDIIFAVRANGIPMAVALEIKFGTGTLSREQSDMLFRMQAAPNAWTCRVIRSFIEVVDFLRDLNV